MEKSPFKSENKDFRKMVEASFSRQPFMGLIGADLMRVEPGYCVITVPYDVKLTQQHGFFHAGIIGTVADNTAGYAGFSLMEMDSSILTVEFKINLLFPGDGESLLGRSRVIKKGKTLIVCTSEVFIVNNGTEKLCAVSQSTLIELKHSADTPSGAGVQVVQ